MHNEILSSFEKQEITNLCAINLSVAFDTVDHGIMISTIENTFGLSGNTLSWLSSYLVLCSFNVSIEGNMLADKPVSFSVPQGSVAGPTLFDYYVGSLPDCIRHDGVLINGFADDHTLHNSYQAGDISAETNSIRILEDSLCSVNDWMGQNKLHMNPSKMEYISYGSKTMIKRITITNITVCNGTVICSQCIKLLGHTLINHLLCLHTSLRNVAWHCGTYHIFDPSKTTWILIPSRLLFRPYASRILTTAMHCPVVFPQKILIASNVFKIPVQN